MINKVLWNSKAIQRILLGKILIMVLFSLILSGSDLRSIVEKDCWVKIAIRGRLENHVLKNISIIQL